MIPDGHSNVLYGQGVDGGNITPHNIPPPPPHHQLEADDIWTVEAELFGGKVLRLVVENCDAAVYITPKPLDFRM